MNKKFYFSNLKMRRLAYFYFTLSIIMAILYFITFIFFLIVISILTFLLGIHFYRNLEKVIIFEIKGNKIFYKPKKNYGILRHNDFYNLFINNKLDEIEISSIKTIEKTNSFLKGNNIYLINDKNEIIELLLGENKTQNNEIFNDLNKLMASIPKNELEKKKINSNKNIIHIEKENYHKTITIEKSAKKIYTQTSITYNNKPNVKNKLLVSETITALVTIMKRFDQTLEVGDVIKKIMIENDVDYDSLLNTIDFINKNTIDDCKSYIKEKIKECKNEYTKNTIEYIFKTSLSSTKYNFFINPEIEQLIKELLISADYGEIGLDHTIAQLRI